jgi:hypothetical protein
MQVIPNQGEIMAEQNFDLQRLLKGIHLHRLRTRILYKKRVSPMSLSVAQSAASKEATIQP